MLQFLLLFRLSHQLPVDSHCGYEAMYLALTACLLSTSLCTTQDLLPKDLSVTYCNPIKIICTI